MKGGFNLLETRSIDDELDLTEFENSIGSSLPSLYKLFLKTFIVGESKVSKEKYMLEGDLYPCSSYVYKPMEHIGFSHFLTQEMSLNVWNDLDDTSYAKKELMIPIGATGTSAIIFVGASGDNKDQIYFEYESDWTLVCSNIFEFVRGITFWTREDDPSLRQTIPFDKLSRRWREGFWRITNQDV